MSIRSNSTWKLKLKQLENNKLDVKSVRENHKEFMKSNNLILKSQQKFRREKHDEFTEEVNKIAPSANGDKRIKSIDSIATYAYGTNKEIIHKKLKKLNISL